MEATKRTNPATATGYVHCAHTHCFAIIIGRQGDLCDDCKDDADKTHCEGCDNDSDVEFAPMPPASPAKDGSA